MRFLNQQLFLIIFLLISVSAFAQQPQFQDAGGFQSQAGGSTSLWGSGTWGGQQGCSTQMKVGLNAVNESDDVKQEKQKITSMKAQLKLGENAKKRAENEIENLTKKIERYLDSDISDFLINTHLEKMNKCDSYKNGPEWNCQPDPVVTAQMASVDGKPLDKTIKAKCDGLDDVIPKLKDKWILPDGGGFCNATSNSSRGQANYNAICSDPALRPSDAPKYRSYSANDCSKTLSELRKKKIELGNVQAKIEKSEDEIRDREYAVADLKERASLEKQDRMRNSTESVCEDCAMQGRNAEPPKSNTNWLSAATSIVGGLGLIYYGKKSDAAATAYNAQLGFPSNNSYGYPYVSAGIGTIINGVANANSYGGVSGGAGQGAFGCGGNTNQNQNLGLYGNNMSASNSGGAFGYPQSMGGTNSLSGGMYSSYNPYSSLYGNNNSNLYGNNYGTNSNIYGNYGSNLSLGAGSLYGSQNQTQLLQMQQQTNQVQQQINSLQLRLSMLNSGYYNNSNLSNTYSSNYGLTNTYYNTNSGLLNGSYSTLPTTSFGNSTVRGR